MTPPKSTRPKEKLRAMDGGTVASFAGRLGWVLYEFSAGPAFVLVNIFVFAPYFSGEVVGDDVRGQELWGYIQAAGGLLIALFSPILGAFADALGPRKPAIAVFVLFGTAGLFLLYGVVPGAIALAAGGIILALTTLEYAAVFHQAMLPAIISEKRIGSLSGLGYAISYFGAMLGFAVWLALPSLGVLPDAPFAHERVVGPLSAIWCLIFFLPFMIFTPDNARTGRSAGAAFGEGLRVLRRTLGHVRHYRNIAIFLISRMVYYDGLTAVFVFIGIYAKGVFGWNTEKVAIFGLILIVLAAVSAIFGGMVDDRVGSKRTILTSLVAFAIGLALAISMGPGTMFFFVAIGESAQSAGVPGFTLLAEAIGFAGLTDQAFMLCAMFGSLFVGPALASSRTLLARIAPPERIAEFFGLYTLTGKATAFLAPLAIGIITGLTGDQRAGFAAIFVFVGLGFLGLCLVKERRTAAAR